MEFEEFELCWRACEVTRSGNFNAYYVKTWLAAIEELKRFTQGGHCVVVTRDRTAVFLRRFDGTEFYITSQHAAKLGFGGVSGNDTAAVLKASGIQLPSG